LVESKIEKKQTRYMMMKITERNFL